MIPVNCPVPLVSVKCNSKGLCAPLVCLFIRGRFECSAYTLVRFRRLLCVPRHFLTSGLDHRSFNWGIASGDSNWCECEGADADMLRYLFHWTLRTSYDIHHFKPLASRHWIAYWGRFTWILHCENVIQLKKKKEFDKTVLFSFKEWMCKCNFYQYDSLLFLSFFYGLRILYEGYPIRF